jgi:hypothetical protein
MDMAWRWPRKVIKCGDKTRCGRQGAQAGEVKAKAADQPISQVIE